MMTSDEIRERYLSFFEERGHPRIPSASLVPSAHDPSALLTVAGMHPLKPYFLGQETPPAPRLTSCQKVFRTVDIDNVGNTARHLTFFEMLGNFSFGDYFKREAIEFAWELSREVFGFAEEDIWVTVFEGDEELGLGPDEEAIELLARAGRAARADRALPALGELLAGRPDRARAGRARSCTSTAASSTARRRTCPGGENERFLEYWNLVFMQYDQQPAPDGAGLDARSRCRPTTSTPASGLNRMAAILQEQAVGVRDRPVPAADRARRGALGPRATARTSTRDRALRILADHSRAMTFLIADGVVPSNEDRGYVLRRVMRRAIQQGRALELAPGFLRALRRARARADGRRLPGAGRAGRARSTCGCRRGGGLRAHARAGHGDAATSTSSRRARRARAPCRPRRSSACTTPSASRMR